MNQTQHEAGMRVRFIWVASLGFAALVALGSARAGEPEELYAISPEARVHISWAQFSADGKKLFTLGNKPLVGIWDAKTGKAIRSVDPPGVREVVAVSADGSLAAGYGKGELVVVWDLDDGKQLAELKGHTDGVLSIRFSPDGSRVVTASRDKTAKVWEAKTGKLVTTLTGHTLPVASAEFSSDGTRVATGSYAGEIIVWDAKTGKEQLNLQGMSTSNNPTVFSTDDKYVVSPRFESPAVWTTKDGKLVQEFKGHKGWCRTVRFDPTGERIVTAGHDKTARLWEVKTGKVLHTLKHEDEVNAAAFSPDGTRVVTLSGGKARVWQLPQEK